MGWAFILVILSVIKKENYLLVQSLAELEILYVMVKVRTNCLKFAQNVIFLCSIMSWNLHELRNHKCNFYTPMSTENGHFKEKKTKFGIVCIKYGSCRAIFIFGNIFVKHRRTNYNLLKRA